MPNLRGRGAGGLALAVCAFAAFALRLAHWERSVVLMNDGPVFLALAQRFAAGDFAGALAHPFHPLYPLAIAALHGLAAPVGGVSWETAGALVSALAGALAVVALHDFVRRAFGPREAVVAAFLLAFHAGSVETGGDVQSESLYLALFLGTAALLWRALEGERARSGLLAGAAAGLAYLTRPEGALLALVGVALAGLALLRGRLRPARGLALAGALALGCALVAAPYVAALSGRSGELVLTRKKSLSWVAGLPGAGGEPGGLASGQPGMEARKLRERPKLEAAASSGPPPERGAPAPRDPDDSLVDPPWTARSAPHASFDLLETSARALRAEMAVLAALGLLALRGRPGARGQFIGAIVGAHAVVLFALAMNVGYVSRRHALPPLALLLGYAAVGTQVASTALARSVGGGERARRALAALVLALVATLCIVKEVLPRSGLDGLAERRAAEWVRSVGGPDLVVAAERRRYAYYAGAPFVQLRPKTAGGFTRYFDDYGVRYVIVEEGHLAKLAGLPELIGGRLTEVRRVDAAGTVALVLAWSPEASAAPAAGP